MFFFKLICFLSIIILVYHLIIYRMILQIIIFFKKKVNENINNKGIYFPTVTILTSIYNEEKFVENKIKSFLNLDYPNEKIKLVFVSDGSTDGSNSIISRYVKKYNNIELIIQQTRKGKASALNLAEPQIKSSIVISSDASSILTKDSAKKLVKHFKDSNIGLVSGNLIYKKEDGMESGEGLYWKYESGLRKMESKLNSVIVASGCLFAIKRCLYKQIHPASPDDFERTLITLKKGYKTIIETDATVYEFLTKNPSEEFKRKVRIISREWFALFRHSILLNPLKYPKVSFFLISHKLIRWLLPFISFGIFFPCIVLFNRSSFKLILFIQIIIYGLGLLELYIEKRGKSLRLLKIFGYWIAMNIASFLAFVKFISGKQQSTWDTN